MRLYVNSKGEWFGTKLDARRLSPRDWREVDVPTSKPKLRQWLEIHKVGAVEKAVEQPAPTVDSGSLEEFPKALSWVKWAYETLKRGDKREAQEMLRNGLGYIKTGAS